MKELAGDDGLRVRKVSGSLTAGTEATNGSGNPQRSSDRDAGVVRCRWRGMGDAVSGVTSTSKENGRPWCWGGGGSNLVWVCCRRVTRPVLTCSACVPKLWIPSSPLSSSFVCRVEEASPSRGTPHRDGLDWKTSERRALRMLIERAPQTAIIILVHKGLPDEVSQRRRRKAADLKNIRVRREILEMGVARSRLWTVRAVPLPSTCLLDIQQGRNPQKINMGQSCSISAKGIWLGEETVAGGSA
ncbi:hypothetical protein BDZ89DRAFT_651140 [Hymenopellis radicata]|nr:hypothetical protein BDZ89DRAFT_651140 [Hymenopellis radicata]